MPVIEIDWSQTITPEMQAEQAQALLRDSLHREREARIAQGKTFALSFGTVPLRGTTFDQIVLQSLLQRGMARQIAGNTDADIVFRDDANVDWSLTGAQAVELAEAGMLYVQTVMQASWALKDGETIPEDFADDSYWPAR